MLRELVLADIDEVHIISPYNHTHNHAKPVYECFWLEDDSNTFCKDTKWVQLANCSNILYVIEVSISTFLPPAPCTVAVNIIGYQFSSPQHLSLKSLHLVHLKPSLQSPPCRLLRMCNYFSIIYTPVEPFKVVETPLTRLVPCRLLKRVRFTPPSSILPTGSSQGELC